VHIGTDFLLERILFLKFEYSFDDQTFENDFPFRIPISFIASLSKQQGTTLPSHVITEVLHKAKQ
jgi:hypothetical protein